MPREQVITPEMLDAGKAYIRMAYYNLQKPLPEGFDLEGGARKLFAAPDSRGKRHFQRFVSNAMKNDVANQAATAAGLYDIYGLYAALCDVSEHIMHGQGKKKYRTPAIYVTSNEARRSASDIVAVIKRNTGFDLMGPVGSLGRMQRPRKAAGRGDKRQRLFEVRS
jgi:hypothetical protein